MGHQVFFFFHVFISFLAALVLVEACVFFVVVCRHGSQAPELVGVPDVSHRVAPQLVGS